MGTRLVRLDDEAEEALADIAARTGLSISEVVKQGLISYREITMNMVVKHSMDFFKDFDLREGGYTISAAWDSKSSLKERIKKNVMQKRS